LGQDYLKTRLIQNNPYASPVVLVGNKDGMWTLCVDYRDLNKNTIINKFHVPLMDDVSDGSQGSPIFSKIDLRAGYNQMHMNPDDIHKTHGVTMNIW